MAKRFSRKTQGYNAQVFVAKAIDYTTDATLALFLANAPVGELGVYDANGALHDNAITATEKFQFLMKMADGGIKASPFYSLSEIVASKKLYQAPVKQVSSIGWNGTGGSLNAAAIAAGLNYEFAVIETTEGYEPYPVWNYNYVSKASDALIDVMQYFAKKINDDNAIEHKQNKRLVDAKVKADATYGNYAIGAGGTLTVTNGSDVITTAVGTIDIALNDYISFDAAAAPTDAVGDIYKVIQIIDANNFRLNRVYTGATQTFIEAEAEGTRVKKVTAIVTAGLQLTCIDFDTHFRLAVREELVNADITYTTPFTKSNGTYEDVYYLEQEGQVFEGDTAKNAPFADKFGQQVSFAVAGETYDYYMFNFTKRTASSGGPNAEVVQKGSVVIPVAKSAGNVDGTLNTLFGL